MDRTRGITRCPDPLKEDLKPRVNGRVTPLLDVKFDGTDLRPFPCPTPITDQQRRLQCNALSDRVIGRCLDEVIFNPHRQFRSSHLPTSDG